MKKFFLASLKSLKKVVGSGSVNERYGSPDPDPHQNVTDPEHWFSEVLLPYKLVSGLVS